MPVVLNLSDRDLNDAILKFQKERGLKVDGKINPGGETETTLVSTLLGLDRPAGKRPAPVRRATEAMPTTMALPMVAAGAAPAMTGAAGIIRSLPALIGMLGGAIGLETEIPTETGDGGGTAPETGEDTSDKGDECDDEYAYNMSECDAVFQSKGDVAAAVCRKSASDIYAACLAGRVVEDRPPLQK